MIVLFWSRATRDLLKSFGWGIAALHRLDAATKLPFPRRPPHCRGEGGRRRHQELGPSAAGAGTLISTSATGPSATGPSATGPSAARAGRDAGSMRVPRLRPQAGEARRGHRRDTGNHPAPSEGDPDDAGEIHSPVLRENHSAPRCRPDPRQRCDRAGAGQKQGRDRAAVDRRFREGRLYVRDDRPFGGGNPPATMFFYSRGRGGEHPRRHLAGWAGILQADAGACPRAGQRPDPGAGFGELDAARRSPRPITEAACQAHGRRKFFVLADLRQGPLRGHSGATQEPLANRGSSPHRRDLRRRARDRRCRT